jgi:hypothetical protein
VGVFEWKEGKGRTLLPSKELHDEQPPVQNHLLSSLGFMAPSSSSNTAPLSHQQGRHEQAEGNGGQILCSGVAWEFSKLQPNIKLLVIHEAEAEGCEV